MFILLKPGGKSPVKVRDRDQTCCSSSPLSASDSGSIVEDPWVILRPDGLMGTFARQRLTFTCHFNLFKFPFDVQRCNITFLSMGADGKRPQACIVFRASGSLTRVSSFLAQ